ncbi:MAG: phage holin family protein, partial [Thermodesulfobacteriota bacterium]
MASFSRHIARLTLKIFLNAASLWFIAWYFDGITLTDWNSAVIAVLTLLFINVFIKPFVKLLTLPFNILSFGLLTFVINALLFKLTSTLTIGFNVEGAWTAVGGALFYSFLSVLIN